MKLFAVSNAYADLEVMTFGVSRFYKTTNVNISGYPSAWVLVDNHWPLNKRGNGFEIQKIQKFMDAYLVDPGKNLGGHGGTSFGLSNFGNRYGPKINGIDDDDLVLNYDLDSNPITEGWLEAMIEVMNADPTLGYVALLDNRCEAGKPWTFETIAGHKIALLPHADMWNVTLFRGKVIKDGMKADTKYYGLVETAMRKHMEPMGLRMGYLYDFREDVCPINHPHSYFLYKQEHAAGRYAGTFEEYLKEKQS